MSSSLNVVDYMVLAVLGVSVIAGFFRGFFKEAISLLSWLAAYFVSSLFARKLAAWFSGSSASVVHNATGVNVEQPLSMIALGGSFVALFIATLAAGSILSYLLTSVAEGVGIGFVNRLFGGAFGIIRGSLLVIVLMFIAELTPMGNQAAWVNSKSVIYFQPAVQWVESWVHPGLENIKSKAQQASQLISNQMKQVSNLGQ